MILPNPFSPIKNKGFTLIELLVVIAIIGILLSLGLAGFQRAQMNARDVRRIQDMDQVKIALEMYFETNLEYPERGSSGQIECDSADKDWGTKFECDSQIFMRVLPEDPTQNPEYCYVAPASAPFDDFQLYAQMENDNNANISPETCQSESYNFKLIEEQ